MLLHFFITLDYSLMKHTVNDITKFDTQFPAPLCGIDEVGRGPLAGPVTSACVMIKSEFLDDACWGMVTDSKKLTAKKREALYQDIIDKTYWGLADVSVEEIDNLNIHHATLLAMKRAYEAMIKNSPSPSIALIDGKFSPDIDCATQTVIKGDSLSVAIGAASILAKVARDRLMAKLHAEHPHYAWDRNAGYGTKAHKEGLETHGLTPHHRLSYAPCAALSKVKKES